MTIEMRPDIAEVIIRVRQGRVYVTPGYDGIYGQLVLFEENSKLRMLLREYTR